LSEHLLFLALDVIVVFAALLLALRCVAVFPQTRNALLFAGILLGNVCYVVLTREDFAYWIPEIYQINVGEWRPLLNLGRNLTPALFMMLCHSLFQEQRRFPRWLLALFGVQLFLEEPIHLLVPTGAPQEPLITETIPGALETVFAGFAFYWTIAGWRSDLVETRRRLRWVLFVLGAIGIIGNALLLRVVDPWHDLVLNYYVHVFFVGTLAALLSVFLLRFVANESIEQHLSPGIRVKPAGIAPEEASRQQAAEQEVARLQRLMQEERVYQQAGLSVRSLAEMMGMPEYRLRKLIHEQLGYRNFNAFLHDYRIQEACEMLSDPDQSRKPILTIALSVGYQSINTFNRGFREVIGITPSAYRTGTPRTDDGAPGAGAGGAPETGASSQAK
jgi:AraC-like DNA-binding protein